jgi:hypothetical protein
VATFEAHVRLYLDADDQPQALFKAIAALDAAASTHAPDRGWALEDIKPLERDRRTNERWMPPHLEHVRAYPAGVSVPRSQRPPRSR